jgi:mannose-6-phosphate isomerase-like protein (cupin superfamily)
MTRLDADDWAVDPVFKMRSRFWRNGDVQHVETIVEPGGGVTPHVHPTMHERFVVHEGRCQFLAGRRWVERGEGESIEVPPGTRHAFRNRGPVLTRIECEASPASTLQGFLEDAAGMSRAGKLMKIGLPKPGGLLEAAVLVDAYADMVHLGFPAPPWPVQKVVFGRLARVAEKRGIRAGELKNLA